MTSLLTASLLSRVGAPWEPALRGASRGRLSQNPMSVASPDFHPKQLAGPHPPLGEDFLPCGTLVCSPRLTQKGSRSGLDRGEVGRTPAVSCLPWGTRPRDCPQTPPEEGHLFRGAAS